MPIYEYECESPARHRFEKWQSIKDDALTECPTCGSPVHKIFHPAGIIFKGSGWYITDSRKGGSSSSSESKPESKSDATKSDSTTKSDSSKTDSKGTSSENAS